ncbi:hypothetical protein ABW21_db0204773 [Orbilia brochopaga]|nr:hypothetical protein ABW21_db0204773 [Drechslerella brochopaga]
MLSLSITAVEVSCLSVSYVGGCASCTPTIFSKMRTTSAARNGSGGCRSAKDEVLSCCSYSQPRSAAIVNWYTSGGSPGYGHSRSTVACPAAALRLRFCQFSSRRCQIFATKKLTSRIFILRPTAPSQKPMGARIPPGTLACACWKIARGRWDTLSPRTIAVQTSVDVSSSAVASKIACGIRKNSSCWAKSRCRPNVRALRGAYVVEVSAIIYAVASSSSVCGDSLPASAET